MQAACVAFLLVATAGCSAVDVNCTDMLPLSQVRISNGGASLPDGATAEACLVDECSSAPWRDGQVFIPLDTLPLDGIVELRLRKISVAGTVIDEERLTVEARTVSPNGPGCEPKVGLVKMRRVDIGTYEQDSA